MPIPPTTSAASRRRYDILAAVLIASAVAILWIRLAGVASAAGESGWLGWDAYPILESTRVASASDLLDVATRRLAGEHLKASFYRPFFALTVSAEQSWFGATPFTSLVWNVLLFGGCLAALWWWLASWDQALDGAARPAGLVALGLLALHPSVFDVVPYLPRRADLLCVLWLLLALGLDRHWLNTGKSSVFMMSLACALLAMASKETALVLPVLIVATRTLLPAGGAPKFRQLAKVASAYSVAVGILLIPRLFVLGGAGGYPAADREVPFSPKVIPTALVELLVPHSGLESRTTSWVGMAILWLAALLGSAFVASRRALPKPFRVHLLPGWLRLLALSAVWCLTLAALFAVAGRVSPWYLFILGCGGFVGLGAVSSRAWLGFRTALPAELAWGVPWLVGLLLLGVSWWPGSLAGGSTVELRDAGRKIEECLAQAELRCREATRTGARIQPPECPETVVGHGRRVAAVKPRSLVAWAEIKDLSCTFRVTSSPSRP